MSSSFITTTTRHEIDATYVIDSFLPSVNFSTYQHGQQMHQKYTKANIGAGSVLTSTPTASISSQSNLMTYDCLSHHQHPTTNTPTGGVSAIPIENLSIQHSSIDNEWISPIGLNYPDYNSQDINFLFAYNDLAISNKDISNGQVAQCTSTPSESSSSINDDTSARNNMSDFQQTTAIKGPVEQYRRFSMMDIGSSRAEVEQVSLPFTHPYAPSQQHQPFLDFNNNNNANSLLYQQQQPQRLSSNTIAAESIHKERSSMPNVFIGQQTVPSDNFMNQQQDPTTGQLTWQQSDLLQKKPMSTSSPFKEDEDVIRDSFAKYNCYNMGPCDYIIPPSDFISTMSSSVSSPLKKHAKKRSMIDEVLHEDVTSSYAMPSIVPSMSEPIPTAANWIQQQQQQRNSRKRTKSIRNNSLGDCHPMDNISSSSSRNNTTIENDPIINCTHEHQQYHHQQHHQQQHQQQHQVIDNSNHENYMLPKNDLLPPPPSSSSESTTTSTNNYTNNDFDVTTSDTNGSSSNQLLAAMPRRQKLRYDGDSYTPKWVRYTGHLKEGYCDSCNPGKWLQLKNSAYWYHKQFYHGISSVSGKSFMKPIEQRMGKGDMIEGLCHQCHRFVPACNGKKKNNYMLWYRHAHKCHLYDKPKATSKSMRKLSIASSSTSPNDTPLSTPTSSTTTNNTISSTSHHQNNII